MSNRIIFVNRYYRPDNSATAQLLTDLAEKLAAQGHDITVICSRQRYENPNEQLPPDETLDGVNIHRIWTTRFGRANLLGRAFDYLSFYLSSFFYLLKTTQPGDRLIVKTDPPMLSVIGAPIAIIKGATLINWLQDLFPEVAQKLGVRIFQSPLYRVTKSLRNWSLRAAQYNVVLGRSMAERVNAETGQPEKTRIIPNWVIQDDIKPLPKSENPLREQWQLSNKFIVGYSGNLGRAHDYQSIYNAALTLRENSEVVFLFIGGGAGYTALRDLVQASQLDNIYFQPYQPTSILPQSLALPDLHIVTLEPELEGLIIPSKTYGILAAGRPILYIGDTNGEIANLVENAECGKAIAKGDASAIASWIRELSSDPEKTQSMATNARLLYESEYSNSKSIASWKNLLEN